MFTAHCSSPTVHMKRVLPLISLRDCGRCDLKLAGQNPESWAIAMRILGPFEGWFQQWQKQPWHQQPCPLPPALIENQLLSFLLPESQDSTASLIPAFPQTWSPSLLLIRYVELILLFAHKNPLWNLLPPPSTHPSFTAQVKRHLLSETFPMSSKCNQYYLSVSILQLFVHNFYSTDFLLTSRMGHF